MENSLPYTNREIIDIYNRNVDTVYRISLMYLKNIPDAEDAVQDIFLKLIRENHKFESLEHEKAWLIVTSQNYCKNILKNWWRKKRTDINNTLEPSYKENFTMDSTWQQVLKLPKKYKMVIYLYYYEGYTTDEISKILQTKSSTIRSRLYRARKRLKIIIEEESLDEGKGFI
ncbi:MAG: sigma-70 family RNA polymerase sigma factor [Tissierellia bacterium]|nr:sigma-70 family RNA polymerase sigma factor [Tissierellia bacterium]